MREDPGAAEDRALLLAAAEEAGAVAMTHFRARVRSWEKAGGQGPVSDADLAVNEALRARLLPARPDYGWLSEEDPDDASRLAAERVFVVDPIDGTRAFLKGEPDFAVALAVVRGGRAVAAVVHLPAHGETYAAHVGGGATLNAGPLAASTRRGLDGARAIGGRAMMKAEHWTEAPRDVAPVWCPALAVRLCRVAAGTYDLLATFHPAWEWDVAAGALIATEAGAIVTDGLGRALSFNSPGARTEGLLAASPAVHAEALARRRL